MSAFGGGRLARRRAHSLAVVALSLLLLAANRPPGLGDVADVRTWSYDAYTRVVVQLTRSSRGELKRLAADARAGRPERLYVDLPGIWVGKRWPRPIEVGDGLLADVRLGQNTSRTTRLVVDLENYGHHRLFFLDGPPRVVLDVYGASRMRRVARPSPTPPPVSARPPRAAPTPARPSDPRLPIELRGIQTVVIDPGHGGKDPGAVGVGGLREKDLTLMLARELAQKLRERGFDVVLTRTKDETLSLEARTARAEGARGDVFISIHANAAPRRAARGVETYYLDANHERHAMRVAARENGVSAGHLDDLQRSLAELRVSEVGQHSASLARTVHGEMVRGIRASHGTVRDLGVKRGPFHVLFLSGMPAILMEVGFVTNQADARRLRSRFYRSVLAEHIARGLSRYRSERAMAIAGTRDPRLSRSQP